MTPVEAAMRANFESVVKLISLENAKI